MQMLETLQKKGQMVGGNKYLAIIVGIVMILVLLPVAADLAADLIPTLNVSLASLATTATNSGSTSGATLFTTIRTNMFVFLAIGFLLLIFGAFIAMGNRAGRRLRRR